MSKARVIYKQDKTVSVIHIVSQREGETEEQTLSRIQSKDPDLKGLPFEDMDVTKLPVRDKNRNKWRGEKGKGIWVDHSVKTEAEKHEEEIQDLVNTWNTLPADVKTSAVGNMLKKLANKSGANLD
jgi:hypothetical protein